MKKNWMEVKLEDVCDITMGQSPPSSTYNTDRNGLPFFQGKAEFTKLHPVASKWCTAPKKTAKKDDILISVRAPVGSTNIADQECAIGRGLAAISYKCKNYYLWYYLKYIEKKLDEKGTGTTFKAISGNILKSEFFPLPPLPEQRAIVAKIEALFSDLDNGIADLKKAQEQLKIYRQAVLKKAFEGELTRKWREQQSNLPTAEELLEQIKDEREKHYNKQSKEWEQAVNEWEKNGKQGKKPVKPNDKKEFKKPEKELNLEIPNAWTFTCIGNLSNGVEYGSSAKSKDEGLIPVLRMGNMQNGKIDWDDLKYTNDDDEIKQYSLTSGDVLFNRTNSPELVGKTVEYRGERPAIFAGYLIRINQISSLLYSTYLNYFLNSHPAKVYGSYVKTDGVNQSNINGQKLSNYPIPYCTLEEQHQIVREIETRLSVCDKLEQSITEALEKSDALRQSILKKAFQGNLLNEAELKLCREAPDYEPAGVLLNRIKTGKTANSMK